MASIIMLTISAYFRTHHGNETRTYLSFFFHFTYVQKEHSIKTRTMESRLNSSRLPESFLDSTYRGFFSKRAVLALPCAMIT